MLPRDDQPAGTQTPGADVAGGRLADLAHDRAHGRKKPFPEKAAVLDGRSLMADAVSSATRLRLPRLLGQSESRCNMVPSSMQGPIVNHYPSDYSRISYQFVLPHISPRLAAGTSPMGTLWNAVIRPMWFSFGACRLSGA